MLGQDCGEGGAIMSEGMGSNANKDPIDLDAGGFGLAGLVRVPCILYKIRLR